MTVTDRVTTVRRRRGRAEYHVSARTDSSGEAVIDAAGTPILLQPAFDPGADGLPNPGELLASAFAACLLRNLSRSRALLGFEYDTAVVEVMVERQERPPRFVAVGYTVRVTTDEPERRVALMHASLRKYGTVYNTLASVCHVQGVVEALPRT